MVDQTPPATSITSSQAPFPDDGDVQISLSSADGPSGCGVGVKRIEYTIDNTPWRPYEGPLNFQANESFTLFYRSVDNEDNIESTKSQFFEVTAIELTSFTAQAGDDGVVLNWETAAEIDNEGFNIWRSETEDGEYVKINDALIPAQGNTDTGASYVYTDAQADKGKTYFYKLEDIDTNGAGTFHGPAPAPAGKSFAAF